MGRIFRQLAYVAFLVPLSAPAADLTPPVPVCFERLPDGIVSARATDGGRFQVIPAGGLDNQTVWFRNSVIRRGDTIKAAGVQIQQYVEVQDITPEAVILRNRGWARGIGEFDNTTRSAFDCGMAPPPCRGSGVPLRRTEDCLRPRRSGRRLPPRTWGGGYHLRRTAGFPGPHPLRDRATGKLRMRSYTWRMRSGFPLRIARYNVRYSRRCRVSRKLSLTNSLATPPILRIRSRWWRR